MYNCYMYLSIYSNPEKNIRQLNPYIWARKLVYPPPPSPPHTLFIEVIVKSMEIGYVYVCCPMWGIDFASAHMILFQLDLGDNCIVFENFTASIGYLMVTN